ncbi:MAG: malto-oligosyltrehalose synthase [Methylococcaceae bacterium]|nr:malto-oligosyltrehalose synthase [Methylococcaceae bacterium]
METRRNNEHQLMIPNSTYRLQLNQETKFSDASQWLPYLHRLGISHCYTSPFLKARPGSSHGYDIVDHNHLNPEIGSMADFEQFISVLQHYKMGLIADIVPNHMGIMGNDNVWWLDVLENGPASYYAHFFDIDWHPLKPGLQNKILISVLGDHYGNILDKHELKLTFDSELGEFSVYYFQHRFPIDPQTYPFILGAQHEQLLTYFKQEDAAFLAYQTLDNSLRKLPLRTLCSPEQREERARDKQVFKKQLSQLCWDNPNLTRFIELRVAKINQTNADHDALHTLLEQQAYRLAYWHVAGDEINYRRFFDINDLAGLRAEDEAVFTATHCFILSLIEQGKIQGLRIDHADGLYDPTAYYQRLSSEIKENSVATVASNALPIYIVAEKIVAHYEYLANDWAIHGTTGYEFAAMVNGVFIDSRAEKSLTHTYARFIGHRQDFKEIVYQSKKHVMSTALASTLNMLANQLSKIAESSPKTRDYTLNGLRDGLLETIACFPVYRTYINSLKVSNADSHYIHCAIEQAQQRSRAVDKTVFDFIRKVLLLDAEILTDQLLTFVMKFQQYTAPVMAKGYEDTAIYQYHRLISLNEVGSDPSCFGYSVAQWHHFNLQRAKKWPHSMLCLSSHDTKRSADVRSRINVLSEVPQQWQESVFRWHQLNKIRGRKNTPVVIARNDEYLLYQTFIGTWPLEKLTPLLMEKYQQRIENYMLKAIREAKCYSSWDNPNLEYEQAVNAFIKRCLSAYDTSPFVQDFIAFEQGLRPAGLYNAIMQTLLLLTAPGMPDIYQGNELWRFNLVDPDNRRPVDYQAQESILADLEKQISNDRGELLSSLLNSMADGRMKLYVVTQTLHFRNQYERLFKEGDYLPINSCGTQALNVLAFARKNAGQWVVIIVPRLALSWQNKTANDFWQDTWLELPPDAPTEYIELFSQYHLVSQTGHESHQLSVAEIFNVFPLALLSAFV